MVMRIPQIGTPERILQQCIFSDGSDNVPVVIELETIVKKKDNNFFVRKRPVHLPNVDRYNKPTIIFVTICTNMRKPILANEDMHKRLKEAWEQSTHYIVGKYIIMPDHIHLFCSPNVREATPLTNWIGFWKRLVSNNFKELQPLWQRDCWDTQIRSGDKYSEKWDYVIQNPVRKGLVRQADEWVFKGCLNELLW